MKARFSLLVCFLTPLTALAAAPVPPGDLPAVEGVLKVLDQHPGVRAAEAALRGAQAQHNLLKAGEYEYQLTLTGQRRQVSAGPDFNEWEVGLARGLRLPAKARLDDAIGGVGVQASAEMVGDARHELAKNLLAAWYAGQQALAEAGVWHDQAEVLAELARVTHQRVKRGDVARLDSLLADAALAQGRSQLGLAESRVRSTLAELQASYPELPLPKPSSFEPALPDGDLDVWLEHALEHNHELLAVQRVAEKSRLMLRRAEANTIPNPTLGMFYANEADGNDKVIGLSVSVALPGKAKQASVEIQRAESEAMAQEEVVTLRRLRAEIIANWQKVQASVANYAQLKAAAAAVGEHARLANRAYDLGEIGLTETLQARSNALQATLAGEQARLAANEAIARLLLDAHQLWPLGGDKEPHHNHP